MRIILPLVFLGLIFQTDATAQRQSKVQEPYYPPAGSWERRLPDNLGLDPVLLNEVISIARAAESTNPRSMEQNHYQTFGREPFGTAVGPMKDRGEQTGVIIYKGYVLAAWGEPDRVDMTHSVTKSFLSLVAGLAWDRGMIRNIQDTVGKYVPPVLLVRQREANEKAERFGHSDLTEIFSTPHNRGITWDHLLRQTSDWEGTLWGKPDWADRPSEDASQWLTRSRSRPGSVFEYNDVRVNVLALASLMVWRRPLPQVLREQVMDPIGASSTWRWYGYENSWVVLDGIQMQSVSGGGHWGGGMIINAWDMARFGYLMLRNGKWKDKQLISPEWLKMAATPTPAKPDYGHMNWFLNTDRKFLPSAGPRAVTHVGNGTNIVFVDPDRDLVMVCRWVDSKKLDSIVAALMKAMEKKD